MHISLSLSFKQFSAVLLCVMLTSCCYSSRDSQYPAKPDFGKIIFDSEKNALFGELEYEPWWGALDNKGTIKITNNWRKDNLVKVYIPQLKGVLDYNNKPHDGFVRINKKVVRQYTMLWQAWERAGLLGRVQSWGGGYAARKLTKSRIFLSNHAYGTAFDINTLENPYNGVPASPNKKGSVYELVPIANDFGFYWGGHFCTVDGMHFEVAKILDEKVLQGLASKYQAKVQQ